MISLLRRIFIKNYQEIGNPKVREAHGIFCALFGVVTNLILVAMKIGAAVFLASKNNWVFSMALIGDAINNAGDMASSFVTLIGFKMSGKPADSGHPFGHQRIEYIAGLVVAVMVIFAGLELGKESVLKIISGQFSDYDWVSIIIVGIAILLKLFQGYVNFQFGKAISSPTLKSTAIDSISDAIATTIIGVCGILSITLSWSFLDGYMGVAVACFIIYSGIMMVKETANPLIGEATNKNLQEDIENDVKAHPEILGVHDTMIHTYGPSHSFVSLHAEVDEKLSLHRAHEIADEIEREIKKKRGCILTIHIDPVSLEDPRTNEIREKAESVLKAINNQLSLHDLHVFACEGGETISFDVLVPYSVSDVTEQMIANVLEASLKQEGIKMKLQVNFDRPYHE